MRVAIVGAGAVGLRVARHLSDAPGMERLAITDTDAGRAGAVAASIGSPAGAAALLPNLFNGSDVAVLCGPSGGGEHRRWAEAALEAGAHVVSVADGIDDVRALLELDLEARERNLAVVTGAGFSPGLSCVLASHAGTELTAVDEVHVAKAGTGGPACARQHRQAQRTGASEWRDGAWIRRRSGSGRKLCWFPEPVGGRDCYRAGVADGLVLVPAFPGVSRVSARVAASHRERLASRVGVEPRPAASWLGLVKAANTDRLGAVRVEVRGRVGLT
ncbi:MAG: Gfo/Idh/MocA family oxidoreductase, partial [Acidimicrobiales bacterium]